VKFNFHSAALAHVIRHDFEKKRSSFVLLKKKEKQLLIFHKLGYSHLCILKAESL